MDWTQFVVQWLHVLFGITWFGASLTANLILVPALSRFSMADQQRFGAAYGAVAEKVLRVAASAVIVLGFLRGTVWGPIKGPDVLFGTEYGLTWLVGLVAAVLTFAWAETQITPNLRRLNALQPAEALTADGSPTPALLSVLGAAKRNAALEMLGFFIIFTCMILMRFGL
jgi:uncharacterized membrane protein